MGLGVAPVCRWFWRDLGWRRGDLGVPDIDDSAACHFTICLARQLQPLGLAGGLGLEGQRARAPFLKLNLQRALPGLLASDFLLEVYLCPAAGLLDPLAKGVEVLDALLELTIGLLGMIPGGLRDLADGDGGGGQLSGLRLALQPAATSQRLGGGRDPSTRRDVVEPALSRVDSDPRGLQPAEASGHGARPSRDASTGGRGAP